MKGENLKRLTEKKPRLFYYEEAISAWVPAPDNLENIIDLDSHFSEDKEIIEVQFKRLDLSDLEMEALPDE